MNKIKKLFHYWSWKRIISNIGFLIKNDLYEEEYRIKDEAIEDCIYEFEEDNKILKRLDILSPDETLDLLYESPKSLSRYGDGEIKIIQGIDCEFQKYHPDLAKKMTDILTKKRNNLYVGLNGAYFSSPYQYGERHHRYYRENGTRFRRFFLSLCDTSNKYLDAGCFCAYYRYGDSYDYEAHYKKCKRLFDGKKIALVCGKGIFDKLTYDIFDKAIDKILIEAPAKDAFDNYSSIIYEINEKVPKDYLVCIVLGMTATALAADLADEGYVAWDIGHIVKDYDAYMRGLEKTESNMNSFWAAD